jgi:MFS transporter, FHS family, L-fucose permease
VVLLGTPRSALTSPKQSKVPAPSCEFAFPSPTQPPSKTNPPPGAPLLASYVFFKDLSNTTDSLKTAQWTYLGVACFVVLLAVVFWFVPMPGVTDADMGLMEEEIAEIDPGRLRIQYHLFLGVISQFCYVGAQVAVAGNFIPFCTEAGLDLAYASKLVSAVQGIYAGMRFVSGFAMMSPAVKPRWILFSYLCMCFILAIIAMNTLGTASVALFTLLFAFESACFATIFTTALRGLGRHTKRGGSFLVAAISGGSVFPAIIGAVVVKRDVHFSMVIPAMGYLVGERKRF